MTKRGYLSRRGKIDVFVEQCGECAICGGKMDFRDCEYDHIQALIHGGDNAPDNWRAVHPACHKKKTKADVQANAKVKRISKGKRPSKRPMPGSKGTPWKKTMAGKAVRRT